MSPNLALAGVNATVVVLLIAAFYESVFTNSINDGRDLALGFASFGLLTLWTAPAWLIVVSAGALARIFGTLGG